MSWFWWSCCPGKSFIHSLTSNRALRLEKTWLLKMASLTTGVVSIRCTFRSQHHLPRSLQASHRTRLRRKSGRPIETLPKRSTHSNNNRCRPGTVQRRREPEHVQSTRHWQVRELGIPGPGRGRAKAPMDGHAGHCGTTARVQERCDRVCCWDVLSLELLAAREVGTKQNIAARSAQPKWSGEAARRQHLRCPSRNIFWQSGARYSVTQPLPPPTTDIRHPYAYTSPTSPPPPPSRSARP